MKQGAGGRGCAHALSSAAACAAASAAAATMGAISASKAAMAAMAASAASMAAQSRTSNFGPSTLDIRLNTPVAQRSCHVMPLLGIRGMYMVLDSSLRSSCLHWKGRALQETRKQHRGPSFQRLFKPYQTARHH